MKRTAILWLLPALLFLFTKDASAFDRERKGFILQFGLGTGYSMLKPAGTDTEDYSILGLGVNTGLGYAPSNKSSIVFGIKANIFVNEVADVWSNWSDKMSGDDIGALGAKLVSPFVFVFSPIFRSHSLNGYIEYNYFAREQAPSLLINGSAGLGILYDKSYEKNYGGLGISAGMGYEFTRRGIIKGEVIYSYVASQLQCITVLATLNLYLY